MKNKLTLIFMIFALSWAGPSLALDKYELDVPHTMISFAVKHMVVSTTIGEFAKFSGTITVDEQDPTKSSVEVIIDAASISTNNPDRDKHLRSADFFDVEKYPNITFKSNKVEKKGDGYVLFGDLTMHGVTKKIEFPFTFNGKINDPWGKTRIGFDADLTLNRQDYGVKWNTIMDNGGLVVDDMVKIRLGVEAIKVE